MGYKREIDIESKPRLVAKRSDEDTVIVLWGRVGWGQYYEHATLHLQVRYLSLFDRPGSVAGVLNCLNSQYTCRQKVQHNLQCHLFEPIHHSISLVGAT